VRKEEREEGRGREREKPRGGGQSKKGGRGKRKTTSWRVEERKERRAARVGPRTRRAENSTYKERGIGRDRLSRHKAEPLHSKMELVSEVIQRHACPAYYAALC
jgi:hypothetical protein